MQAAWQLTSQTHVGGPLHMRAFGKPKYQASQHSPTCYSNKLLTPSDAVFKFNWHQDSW